MNKRPDGIEPKKKAISSFPRKINLYANRKINLYANKPKTAAAVIYYI
jgi:hypothetical protein